MTDPGDDDLGSALHEAFSRFAQSDAIEVDGATISYSQLWADAEAIHRDLGEITGPVAISMPKGRTFYTLLLSCLAQGRSFALVDPAAPPSVLKCVTDAVGGLRVEAEAPMTAVELSRCSIATAPGALNLEDAAELVPPTPRYYISTSGSTGAPRLVEVEHRSLQPFLHWAVPFYEVDRSTRWAQFSGIGFDLTLVDVLTCWSGGGTLVPVTQQRQMLRPGNFVTDRQVTHWHSVPTMLPALLAAEDLSSVKIFTFCGETLGRQVCELLARKAPTARIVNTYGPTEGTLFCTYHEVDPNDFNNGAPASVPIGRAIPGWTLLTIPTQEADLYELRIEGANIALGYLNLASDRFVDAVGRNGAVRRFDTGDVVRKEGGQLYFSHRRDRQVKIRGVRIELGDIEHALAACGFESSAAVAHDGRIHAFIEHDGPLDVRPIMQGLRAHIPTSVLPSSVHSLRSLPRTSSGKIDREALIKELKT